MLAGIAAPEDRMADVVLHVAGARLTIRRPRRSSAPSTRWVFHRSLSTPASVGECPVPGWNLMTQATEH